MNDDTLEEMAMEFVVMAQSEQGLSQPQECALEISKSLRTLRSKTWKEDAEIAKQEMVSGETGDNTDEAYNLGITHAMQAVLKKDEEESNNG